MCEGVCSCVSERYPHKLEDIGDKDRQKTILLLVVIHLQQRSKYKFNTIPNIL